MNESELNVTLALTRIASRHSSLALQIAGLKVCASFISGMVGRFRSMIISTLDQQ